MPLTEEELALLNSILDQCIYAVGTGARMPIQREALENIREMHVEKFGDPDGPLFRDPDPDEQFLPPRGLPRWKGQKKDDEKGTPPLPGISRFILECSVAIGEYAAQRARGKGRRFITDDDIKKAYDDVKESNKDPEGDALGSPGEWCE